MKKRDHILETAERLFSEHGFEGTSIRQLAGAAEVNIAMISYYFGSKEKLFEALVEYRAGSMRDRLRALHEEVHEPVLRMEAMIRLYVQRFLYLPEFHRILYRELSLNRRSELHQPIADILMRNLHEIRRIIQDGIERGKFREVDVDLTIVSFIGTLTQLVAANPVMQQRMMGEKLSGGAEKFALLEERLTRHLVDLLTRHLLAEVPPSR